MDISDPRDNKLRSVKSCNNSSAPLKIGGSKRSSDNEAVKSLDQALCRLKKSRFSEEKRQPNEDFKPGSPVRRRMDMFLDNMSTSYHSNDNASTVSLNFSNYELQRNLSHLNCDSEDAGSDLTGNTARRQQDVAVKDERLERYFRSAEQWMRYREGISGIPFDIPERNEQNQ